MTDNKHQPMRTVFPEWFSHSSNRPSPGWNHLLVWHDESYISHVLEMLDTDIETVFPMPAEEVSRLCSLIIKDITRMSTSQHDRPPQEHLDFFRFSVATEALYHSAARGQRPFIHWWILCGISDGGFMHPVSLDDCHINRLRQFIESDCTMIRCKAPSRILLWGWMLFLYVRNSGAAKEIADSAFSVLFKVTLSVLFGEESPDLKEQAVTTLCQITDWSVIYRPSLTTLAVDILIRLHKGDEIQPTSKKTIGVLLAGRVGNHLELDTASWAKNTLRDHGDFLRETDAIKLLSSSCSTECEFDSVLQRINKTVTRYAISVLRFYEGDVIRFYFNQLRLFGTLNRLVVHYVKRGAPGTVTSLLANWFGVPTEKRRLSPTILDCATYYHGPLYSVEGKCLEYGPSEEYTLADLTQLINLWLERNVILSDNTSPSPRLHSSAQERQCIATEAEKATIAFRRLDQLSKNRSHLPDKAGLVDLSYQQLPIQALMLNELGKTWPLVTSYEEPMFDQPIEKAFLLACGELKDGSPIGEAELAIVEEYLKEKGVAVESHIQQNLSRESLLRAYHSSTYDLIWVSSHGRFDPYFPHKAAIVLSQDDNTDITVTDLLSPDSPKNPGRRLLVLNLCSGGDALIAECPCKMGIAPLLASAEQAVISHLWPVDESVATAFGILMSIGLVECDRYFDAFVYALENLGKNPDDLLALLKRKADRQVDTYRCVKENSSSGFRAGVFHWGSPVFFE